MPNHLQESRSRSSTKTLASEEASPAAAPWRMLGAASLLLALAGCSSSGGSSDPSVYGDWVYTNAAGTGGIGLTLKNDGTYVAVDLELTSATSARAEMEAGTFTIKGSTMTFTPLEWSCPGPDSVSTLSYSFRAGDLVLSQPSGIISLQPNDSPSSGSVSIQIGCFDRNTGAFTPEPLAPVSH